MSEEEQYIQLATKLNGRIWATLYIADPKSYVMFDGVPLLKTDIGSIAVRQVGADDVSVQASNPSGAGPQRKLTVKLKKADCPEGVVLVTFTF